MPSRPERDSNFGSFSSDGTQYILKTSRTPSEWYNVHFSDVDHKTYYSLTSNLANGIAFARNEHGFKAAITPDTSRTVYFRDTDTGEIWTIAGYPVKSAVENYSCVYTLHDTTLSSEFAGIRVTLRYFVPVGVMYEICTIKIENLTDRPRRIEVMPYVPVNLSSFPGGSTRHQVCRYYPEIFGLFAQSVSPKKPSELFNAFMVSSRPVEASFGDSQKLFHGVYSLADPDIAADPTPAHQDGYAFALCFFMKIPVAAEAGACETVHVAVGSADSVDSVKPIAGLLGDTEQVENLLGKVRDEYRSLTAGIRIRTGEHATDSIMNFWIKKQMRSYLSFKNAYRDNLQIDMAYSMVDPERALDNALDVLGFQYLDGHVPHSCRPLNTRHYSDKPTWILMTFPELIKETGDFSILDIKVPYLEADGARTTEKTPVWEHLIRTMRHLELDVGRNGISRMHHADWNDGLDSLSGDGESTLTSLFFCKGLLELERLARRIGDTRIADEAREIYNRFSARINTVCWDGEWYNRGFTAAGSSIGSSSQAYGKIFLNPQVWAVISEVADAQRTRAIMEQVDRYLETDLGMKLADPTFTSYDPSIGTMSANPPGIAENGVYLHASAFKLVADCMAGRPDAAWRLMKKILPDSPSNPLEQSRCLPFAVTNSFSAAPSQYGLAGSPWRTGTAGWLYRAMIEYILGVRRGYDGLIIDPCLPRQLDKVDITRVFRGKTFTINIDNTSGRGVTPSRILVDNEVIDGNLVLVDNARSNCMVNVTM